MAIGEAAVAEQIGWVALCDADVGAAACLRLLVELEVVVATVAARGIDKNRIGMVGPAGIGIL